MVISDNAIAVIDDSVGKEWRGFYTVCTIAAIVGILGHLTLISSYRCTAIRSSTAYILLAGQLVTDFFLCVYIAVAFGGIAFGSGVPPAAGSAACDTQGFILMSNCYLSMSLACLIALERFKLVCLPRARPIMNKRRYCFVYAFVWVFCLGLSALHFATGGFNVVPEGLYCHVDFFSVASCVVTAIGVVATLGVTACCYVAIHRKIRKVTAGVVVNSGAVATGKIDTAMNTAKKLMRFWLFCVCCWIPCVVQLGGKLFGLQSMTAAIPDVVGMIGVLFNGVLNPYAVMIILPKLRKHSAIGGIASVASEWNRHSSHEEEFDADSTSIVSSSSG